MAQRCITSGVTGSGSIPGQVTPVTYKIGVLVATLPMPGVIASVAELVGPVSVYYDCVIEQVSLTTSISVWQYVNLSKQIHHQDELRLLLGH